MAHSLTSSVVVLLAEGVTPGGVVANGQGASYAGDSEWVRNMVGWTTLGITVGILVLVYAVPVMILWRIFRGSKKGLGSEAKSWLGWVHRISARSRGILAVCLSVFLAFGITSLCVGYRNFRANAQPVAKTKDTLEVEVVAKKWAWQFRYADEYVSDAELILPGDNSGTNPVHVRLNSKDVIHCFFCPEFRLKKDVVPGRTNEIWVSALYNPADPVHTSVRVLEDTDERDASGHPKEYKFIINQYFIDCAQYCGSGHSKMTSRVVVVDPKDYPLFMRLTVARAKQPKGEAVAKAANTSN